MEPKGILLDFVEDGGTSQTKPTICGAQKNWKLWALPSSGMTQGNSNSMIAGWDKFQWVSRIFTAAAQFTSEQVESIRYTGSMQDNMHNNNQEKAYTMLLFK